jgi:hypothetical protein
VRTQPEQIAYRIPVIGIDRYPLATLGRRVDGVKANCYFAFQVAADGVWCQAEPLACGLIGGPVVVMPATVWVRTVGLEGVSPPIHEEAEVIRHYTG